MFLICRIPSRRVSSTQVSASKSPVYSPVASSSDVEKEVKVTPSVSCKGGRRKSSVSATSEPSNISSQNLLNTKFPGPTESRTSSPTKTGSPRYLPDVIYTKNFVVKDEPIEIDKEQRVQDSNRSETCSSSRRQSIKSEDGKQESEFNSHGKSCKRGRRKSCTKPSKGEGDKKSTTVNVDKRNSAEEDGTVRHTKPERSQSVEDSDVEDNIEEVFRTFLYLYMYDKLEMWRNCVKICTKCEQIA